MNSSPRTTLRRLSIATAFVLSPLAHAAEGGITSGGLLRQTPELSHAFHPSGPATAQNDATSSSEARGEGDELRFPINDFVFDGELSPEERTRVEAFIAPLRGRQMTLSALQIVRGELTECCSTTTANRSCA